MLGRVESSLILLLWVAGVSCAETDATAVEIQLRTPAAPDPLTDVVRIRVTISGAGVESRTAEATLGQDAQLEVPPIPLGDGRQVLVEGLGAQGGTISSGRSEAFTLTADGPAKVTVFFRRLNRFSLTAAKLATPRYEHAAVLLADGRVAVVGGRGVDGKVSAAVEIYDPADDSLTAGPPLRRARARHHALLAGDRLLIVGGEDDAGKPQQMAELYDPTAGSTETLSVRWPRTDAALIAIAENRFFYFGGARAGGESAEKTEVLDLLAKQAVEGPENGPRVVGLVGFAPASGSVLGAGGRTDSGEISDVVRSYGAGAEKWSTSKPLAAGRVDARGVVVGGTPWLIGGEGPQPERLVIVGEDTLGPAMAEKRTRHAAVSLNESMALVAGGEGGAAATAERISLSEVEPVGGLNRPRQDHTLTRLKDGTVVLIGGRGGDGKTSVVAEVERFYAQ